MKKIKRGLCGLLLAAMLVNLCSFPAFAGVDGQGDWGDQGDGAFVNPILNADYSDPDIIRVGEKYYMIASTFQLSPGMVILESTDLINWKTINYCIPDMSQFGDKYSWEEMNAVWDGVYAGSLRYLEWKEKQSDGTYVDRHKWFMYTTIYQTGFIVATADDIYGEWTAQFLKDKNGEDLNVPMWDDPCPYWEFNEDGTLKNAYLIASKLKGTDSGNSAWYPHVFQMSLDGMQLLDGDKTYMSMPGDQTRVRNEQGELVDEDGNVIPSGKGYGQNYAHAMNEDGTLPTVLDAIQIPGREGTVVRDIQSAEASKIVTFGEDTAIGQTTFTGRHGENQKVSDYIYIYNNEDWDGIRFAVINRAKSIYGDRFDDEGNYLGPGTPEDPGSYETQRMILSTTNPDTRNPNQGGFIDVPASMSTDGEEHWYWMTQFGRSDYTNLDGQYVLAPDCRATSLQPVTWVEGFPMAGDVSGERSQGKADPQARMYDGTGLNGNTVTDKHHPDAKYVPGVFVWEMEKPPIRGTHEIVNYQGSDDFEYTRYDAVNKLNPMWQWWYQPRDEFWDLTGSALRLYAFRTQDGSDNPMRAGNTVCQRYVSSDFVQADVTLDLSGMQNGQTVGLLHTTGANSVSSIRVKMENGQKSIEGNPLETDQIILRSTVDFNKINRYSYSVDGGKTFHEIGDTYKLILEAYRGDYISIFCYNNSETSATEPRNGYVDVEDFRYTYSRQGDDLNDAAFRTDRDAARGETIPLTATDGETTLWFAPAGTTEFAEGKTMTKAAPGASTIAAPTVPGTYYLYAVHGDGSISNPSHAALTVHCTVTEQRVELENYQWGVSNEAHFWVNTVDGASGGKILDNTLVGDVYYLGEMDLTDVNTISLSMAHETGGVEMGVYVDMEADVSAMTPATQVPDRNDARDRYLGTEHVTGGRKIASLQCGGTGSWTTYQTVTAPVSEPVTGTHDVYLKVDSSSRYGGNLDCLTFASVGHSWADVWTTEGGVHYRACTAEDCDAVLNRGVCRADDTDHCTVCGATMTDLVTVTFASNGGTAVEPWRITRGNPVEAPAAPERTGFCFTGWYLDAELTTPYDFTQPVTEDRTLYAGWEKDAWACTAAAALRVTGQRPEGAAWFSLNLTEAANVATVAVTFTTTENNVRVTGKNGFTAYGLTTRDLGNGTFEKTVYLSYLANPGENFHCTSETAVAAIWAGDETPTVIVQSMTISGYGATGAAQTGTVTGIDPNTAAGGAILNVTEAQRYYRAEAGDGNWGAAMAYDTNDDQIIDVMDLTGIVLYNT